MDPQTVKVIASAAVGFLSSYLAKAGETIAKKAGEDIYYSVKARIEKKHAGREAMRDLEGDPNDSDIQAALRVQLRKLLEEDETWALQLQKLLCTAAGTESGGAIIRQIAGRDAQQFRQVLGDITIDQSKKAVVNIGKKSKIEGDISAAVNVGSEQAPTDQD